MNNLFIVNTPFHLLTSFILSHSFFKNDDNYLALIHPHGYERWADNAVMKYMSTTACGWCGVYPLINFLSSRHKTASYTSQVQQVQKTIGSHNIERIFLGSDIDPQNQLLAASLGLNSFIRYEDGLCSYYNENRRRSFSDALFHKAKIWGLEKLSGINSNLYINTSTASASKAGTADYMYKPQLLQRYSPKAVEITQQDMHAALADLAAHNLLKPVLTSSSVLYLSQPLVEKKLFTLEDELSCLKTLLKPLEADSVLLYKPHPNDSRSKIDYFRQHLPQMVIFDSIEPAELLYYTENNLKSVVSYQSTALMYADKFAHHPIKSISLSDFADSPMFIKYKEIMQNAGVYFPKTLDEIVNYIEK